MTEISAKGAQELALAFVRQMDSLERTPNDTEQVARLFTPLMESHLTAAFAQGAGQRNQQIKEAICSRFNKDYSPTTAFTGGQNCIGIIESLPLPQPAQDGLDERFRCDHD